MVSVCATAGLMFYMFKYVLDKPGLFWVAGIIPTVAGFFTSPLYPVINKWVSRKMIYSVSMIAMIIAYMLLIFTTDNLPIVMIALVLYYVLQGFIFMAVILTLTDTIEYGQLKNGTRNEAVTLAIRPMLDKASAYFKWYRWLGGSCSWYDWYSNGSINYFRRYRFV